MIRARYGLDQRCMVSVRHTGVRERREGGKQCRVLDKEDSRRSTTTSGLQRKLLVGGGRRCLDNEGRERRRGSRQTSEGSGGSAASLEMKGGGRRAVDSARFMAHGRCTTCAIATCSLPLCPPPSPPQTSFSFSGPPRGRRTDH